VCTQCIETNFKYVFPAHFNLSSRGTVILKQPVALPCSDITKCGHGDVTVLMKPCAHA